STPKADAFEPLGPGEGEFRDLLYEKREGVARITLNRPRAYNAYTTGTLRELARAVEDASIDDAIGVIVLTGAGTAAFCTGGDVREYAERYTRRPRDYWKYMGLFEGAVEALLRCGKPTIARLNGITVGGGNELQLACDLSVAASHVYLGQGGGRCRLRSVRRSYAMAPARRRRPPGAGHAAAQRADLAPSGPGLGPRQR
ncbi:Enoyl-CoA hydratase/isomerase, partial [mine drainage metagenome]